MKSFSRILFAALVITGFCCVRNAIAPSIRPVPGLDIAIETVWAVYEGTKPPPYVTLVSGPDLTCANGQGFLVPITGCVYGVTLTPSMCVVAYVGKPWHETSLAHELLHAYQWQNGVLDVGHDGPDWKPGGLLEAANAALFHGGM